MLCFRLVFLFAFIKITTSSDTGGKSFTGRARNLLVEEFGTSEDDHSSYLVAHPILSELSHFDLTEHKTNHGRQLNKLIEDESIIFETEHDGEQFKFQLSRKNRPQIPHFIYNTPEDQHEHGRMLSEHLTIEYPVVNCIYSGHIHDDTTSTGVFNFCNEEVSGVVRLTGRDNDLHIQTVEVGSRRALASWTTEDIIDQGRSCGTHPTEEDISHKRANITLNPNQPQALMSSQLLASFSSVDVFIVNDNKRTDRYTLQAIFQQTLFLVTISEELFDAFPGDNVIELRPVGILSISGVDPWFKRFIGSSVQVDGDTGLLRSFGLFMEDAEDSLLAADGETPLVADILHLLSGEDFINEEGSQGVVGLATIGGVCDFGQQGRTRNSVGTTQDLFIDSNTATVFTHELGHNLGFLHTDDPIDPLDPTSTCIAQNIRRIMDPSGSVARTWSSCSEFWWQDALDSNSVSCTAPQADLNFGFIGLEGPYCGDGIVQGDEECDCGASDCDLSTSVSGQVLDRCCDGATCRYKVTSQCAGNDLCCQADCTFAPQGQICRPPRDLSICDQAEVCSGQSGQCPEDNFTDFGTSCVISGFGGNCYRGSCVSAGEQCDAVGFNNACSNAGDGDAFCQGISGAGIRCQANQPSCFAGNFPQISPSDGTECDFNSGCYFGSCIPYSDIPRVDECFNFEKDGNESDVDCGGAICLPCVAGKNCTQDSDCFADCNLETGVCEGDESVDIEDLFDVIGTYFSDNPAIAALFFISTIGFIVYFFYRDCKNSIDKKEKQKELGGVRQESFRVASARIQSARIQSARMSARFSGALTATAIPEEIERQSFTPQNRRASRQSNQPRSRASARKAAPAVPLPQISVGNQEVDVDDIEARL